MTTTVTGPLSRRDRTKAFVREFERVLARELRPIAIKHGESVAQRAIDNANGRGRGIGNLKHHRPLGLKKNFKVAVAKRAEMERQLRTANTSVPPMFEVQFRSPNPLANWMAEMLEGKNDRVKGNIERPGYGKQPKVTLKPTKAKNFLIPNMRAKFGGAATRLLTDIAAQDSRDPKRRYLSFRSRSGRKRLTDMRPTGGFRWFVAGGRLSTRLRIPKGIYLSPTRRRSGKETKLILAYYLKPQVKVRPNAWFSSALNEWFIGRGGRKTLASMSKEIEVATAKAWDEAFDTKTTEVTKGN